MKKSWTKKELKTNTEWILQRWYESAHNLFLLLLLSVVAIQRFNLLSIDCAAITADNGGQLNCQIAPFDKRMFWRAMRKNVYMLCSCVSCFVIRFSDKPVVLWSHTNRMYVCVVCVMHVRMCARQTGPNQSQVNKYDDDDGDVYKIIFRIETCVWKINWCTRGVFTDVDIFIYAQRYCVRWMFQRLLPNCHILLLFMP